MGSIDQLGVENGAKDLGRQINWLQQMVAIKFWMPDRLSIRSIKELRWTLENPRNWADK